MVIMGVTQYLGIGILVLLVSIFCLLCWMCRGEEKVFIASIIKDLNKIKEKHWEQYPVTNNNKKLLRKKIERFLTSVSDNNPELSCTVNSKGNDVLLLIRLKSFWSLQYYNLD